MAHAVHLVSKIKCSYDANARHKGAVSRIAGGCRRRQGTADFLAMGPVHALEPMKDLRWV